MADDADAASDRNTPKAPKDKNCPYCGQAFTSSSLGRHLDLYIKEKNPKPADGVHNVDEIRQLRGGITRRQPRASLGRRDTSTPAGTPNTSSRRSPHSENADSGSSLLSPAAKKEGTQPAAAAPKPRYPFIHGLEATGVINNIPSKQGEGSGSRMVIDAEDVPAPTPEMARRQAVPARAASRHVLKGQLEAKQKIQDALDTARAAELALREIISSFRAAKQEISMDSTPFDFEPLSLDFPALCLQCLRPPPTLFSSTQLPTPTSWSITAPGKQQCEALQAYFHEEFRKWKISCAAATTAVHEELTYPPSQNAYKADVREAVRRAERAAESQERQVAEHLQAAFSVWDALPAPRRHELWILELARGVGRKQQELDRGRDAEHLLRQENANLRTQIEHLNRLQQPREFKMISPATIPFDRKLMSFVLEEGVVQGRRNVGLTMDDRHVDLTKLVSDVVDRWKAVIVAARSSGGGGGMSAQRPLDQPGSAATAPASAFTPTTQMSATGTTTTATSSGIGSNVSTPTAHQVLPYKQQQQSVPKLQNPPPPTARLAAAAAKSAGAAGGPGPMVGVTATTAAPPTTTATTTSTLSAAGSVASSSAAATPSAAASADGEEENSDLDADAEMEDDDFQEMSTPVNKPPPPPPPAVPRTAPPPPAAPMTPQLEVSRTRAAQSRTAGAGAGGAGGSGARNTRSVSHTTAAGRGRGGAKAAIGGRSVTNVAAALRAQRGSGSNGLGAAMAHADMGMVQGLGGGGAGGEPMFTD